MLVATVALPAVSLGGKGFDAAAGISDVRVAPTFCTPGAVRSLAAKSGAVECATSTPMASYAASAFATIARTSSLEPTSHLIIIDRGLMRCSSARTALSRSAERAQPIITAPRAARSSARRLPIPSDAPVIKMTRSVKFM